VRARSAGLRVRVVAAQRILFVWQHSMARQSFCTIHQVPPGRTVTGNHIHVPQGQPPAGDVLARENPGRPTPPHPVPGHSVATVIILQGHVVHLTVLDQDDGRVLLEGERVRHEQGGGQREKMEARRQAPA
jgi:hypothetical protein